MQVNREGNWRKVADAARTTIGLDVGVKEPTDRWKKNILLAEHSPIRKLKFEWKWEGILSWVSVHFVRHKFGIEHWVKSQRSDRTGIERDLLRQDSPVDHECEANAQAMITISRKRLCHQASTDTMRAWHKVKAGVFELEPVLSEVMVPECIYRGFCPEMDCCGYAKTPQFENALEEYRGGI